MSAILLTQRVANAAVTAAAATVSPSHTPVPFEAVFVFAFASSGAAFTDTTTVSGNGLTWTKVLSFLSGNDICILYQGVGTPAAGATTITFSRAPTSGRYQIFGVQDAQNGSSGVAATQSTNGTNTSGTMTITPSGIGQRFLGFWAHKAAEVTNPDATNVTWTEFSDNPTTVGMEVQSLDGWDLTHTASWVTSALYVGFMVQLLPFAYTLQKESVAPVAMNYGGIAVIEDDEPVWAII